MDTHFSRRHFIIGSAAVFVSEQAKPIAPAALAIWLGLISAGSAIFGAVYTTRRQIEAQAAMEKMRQEYDMRRAGYTQMAQYGVEQERAYSRQGDLARAGFSNNVDGHNTYVGLSQGSLANERGRYSGTMSNQEAAICGAVMRESGVLPVPVNAGYSDLSKAETDAIFRSWEKASGRSEESLRKQYATFCSRQYSSADTPKQGGADLRLIGVVNKWAPPKEGKSAVEFLLAT